ncbi:MULTISPECIES: signal peptidase I [Streptacidiphilus]|uniref:Signal peptidase I n=1 Tax=Streptacidiphilus cavernicola TaxID=3342716 RepID=A0ABV6UNL1_9ACTN|nr:signal peptidase I [Streptacidiphilus jeojiense]
MPHRTDDRPAPHPLAAHPAPSTVAVLAALGCGAALAVGAVLTLRRRLLVVRVDGGSMRPALVHGDRVLVSRTRSRSRSRPKVGDVVVFRLPGTPADYGGRLIKRVAAVPGDRVPASVAAAVPPAATDRVPDRSLVVIGDDPGSVDSRTWGYLPAPLVVGVVLRRLPRTG